VTWLNLTSVAIVRVSALGLSNVEQLSHNYVVISEAQLGHLSPNTRTQKGNTRPGRQ